MDDDTPIIYGLEYQTRALCPQVNETEIKRFLVGTQSLKNLNQIHLVEYDDERNSLTKSIFDHDQGEIWHLASSPGDKSIFLTCHNKINNANSISMKCSIWQFPDNYEMSIAGDDSNHHQLKHLADLPVETSISAIWDPTGFKIASLSDNCIYLLDLNSSSSPKVISTANLEAKGQPKFTGCKWNMHHNNTQIATYNDTAIRGWDLKSMKQTYLIDNAHAQLVRDIDFNPNKPYYLMSCGDDCKTKFWDIRKPNECLKTLGEHSHWVWSARYNPFHDQLVLTCSSDNRVVLNSVPSLSSEPYKTSNLSDENRSSSPEKLVTPDRCVKVYEEHEDSVYAVEWAAGDPWIFASLSYDGRLVINRVPKEEKYNILL